MRRPLAALALTVALAGPAVASASEVSMPNERPGFAGEYRLIFRGGADANDVEIRANAAFPASTGIRVTDAGSTLVAGENCRLDPPGAVCELNGGFLRAIDVDLEAGDDRVQLDMNTTATLAGGPGDDRLVGHGATFVGGPGADLMESDAVGTVTYADRTAGVRVTPDSTANDGEPGEGDDVRGRFGTIVGGAGDDTLSAAPTPAPGDGRLLHGLGGDDVLSGDEYVDGLYGGDGADTLDGRAGNDALWGGAGPDRIRGQAGIDTVTYTRPPFAAGEQTEAGVSVSLDGVANDGAGGEDDDVGSDVENIDGGPGPDTLTGDAGPNEINGRAGDDVIRSGAGDDRLLPGDGADRIDAGPGRDFVVTNLSPDDVVQLRDGDPDSASCSARRPRVFEFDRIDFLLTCFSYGYFAPSYLRFSIPRDATPRLTVHCRFVGGSERCRGTVRMLRRGTRRRLGTARYDLAPRGHVRVTLRLTAEGRRLRALAKLPIPFIAFAAPAGVAASVEDPLPSVKGDWTATGPRRFARSR